MRLQPFAACIAALLFAALAPAFVFAGLGRSVDLLPLAFGVALAHTIVIGVPLFLIFRSKGWVNVFSSTGVGFIVGAIPGAILNWPLQPSMRAMRTNSSVDGVATVIDGIPTAAGWLNYIELLIFLGLFGALGGFVFWVILKWSGGAAPTDETSNHGPKRASYWGIGTHPGMSLAVVAVLLASAVLAIPSITKDRTCHNMFRDGRSSIGPRLSMDLPIATEDWPKLTRVIEDFGATHALSFRNSSRTRPGVVQILYLSLCSDRGINITVDEQRWAMRSPLEAPFADRGVAFGVYEIHKGSGWEQPARDLVAELESLWPGKVKFRGDLGQIIPMPRELQGVDANAPVPPSDAPRTKGGKD